MSTSISKYACAPAARADCRLAIAARHSYEKRELAFGVVTVAILLIFQARWNAPLVFRTGGDPNAMSLGVRNGDMIHRILGILLAVSGFLWCRFRAKAPLDLLRPCGVILLAWVFWLGSSVLWSEDPALTIRRVILLLCLLISAVAFSRLPTMAMFALVSLGALVSLISGIVCELYWGTFQPLQPGYRFAGTAHPNMQGTTLAVGVIAAVGFAASSRRRRRVAACIGVLCLAGLWLTNSRSAMISLLACAALGTSLSLMRSAAKQRKLSQMVGMLLCFTAGTAVMIAIFPGARSTLASAIREKRDEGQLSDFTGRVGVWEVCERYGLEHPVTGYGYDTFWSATHISDISGELHWAINEAHSMYLDLWLDEGVPGTVLFLTLLLVSLGHNVRSFWRGNDSGGVWAMVLLFPLVHGLTESIMVPVTNYPAYVVVAVIFLQLRTHGGNRSRRIQLRTAP